MPTSHSTYTVRAFIVSKISLTPAQEAKIKATVEVALDSLCADMQFTFAEDVVVNKLRRSPVDRVRFD